MKWIPETKKGRTRIEFTPLSMYLRDSRAAGRCRLRPGPIGGRFAKGERRSPEFIARTVLLPERFRVDCAFGGGHAALSHSRRNYSAQRTLPARQSCRQWVTPLMDKQGCHRSGPGAAVHWPGWRCAGRVLLDAGGEALIDRAVCRLPIIQQAHRFCKPGRSLVGCSQGWCRVFLHFDLRLSVRKCITS